MRPPLWVVGLPLVVGERGHVKVLPEEHGLGAEDVVKLLGGENLKAKDYS